MSVYACIYVKTTDKQDPALEDALPEGVLIRKPAKESRNGAVGRTHAICIEELYYTPTYPRGNWPRIQRVLEQLFAAPNVETVWYFGDSDLEFENEPFTQEMLAEYNTFYNEMNEAKQ